MGYKFRNHYECTHCGYHWHMDWDHTCDDKCELCGTTNSVISVDDLFPEEGETEEEHKARMEQIRQDVNKDIHAGRYKGGILHEDISHRNPPELVFTKREGLCGDLYYGHVPKYFVLDEAAKIPILDRYKRYWTEHLPEDSKKPEKDWERTTFVSGSETPPNAAKRKKLRAKRKKHK